MGITWQIFFIPYRVTQSVRCLTTDMCLTAYPGVSNSVPAGSHTFAGIDHELISTVILLLPLIQEGFVVSNKWKYVHKVLVNRLVKLANEKMWLGDWPSRHDDSCWLRRKESNKQTNKNKNNIPNQILTYANLKCNDTKVSFGHQKRMLKIERKLLE